VSSADDSAQAIVEKIQAAGIRATTDPGALNPPAVLVGTVPHRSFDVRCGYTATWTLHALAGAPTRGDRTTGAQLNAMCDVLAGVLPLAEAVPLAYVLRDKSHDSYLITFTEVISL